MGFMDFFKKKNSGNVAKDRLKLLLISDRADCSPDVMENIKNDIIQVISKYMEIDAEGLDIQITQTESDGFEAFRKITDFRLEVVIYVKTIPLKRLPFPTGILCGGTDHHWNYGSWQCKAFRTE